jgi:hypothetical protein
MTAIITSDFRLRATEELIDDLSNNSSYYLGIGRPQEWSNDTNPDNPYDNHHATMREVWRNMIAMKKLGENDISHAVPRYQWISGTTYSEYDDRDTDLESKQYYVISDNNNVYMCLKSGGISTKNPDDEGVTTAGVIDFTASDGYIWKYLFTLSANNTTKFLSSAFIPVVFLESDPGGTADTALQTQWDVQQNAVDGAIYNIKVVNGGSGYTSATVSIEGDGTGAAATATIAGGVVTGVTMTNPGSGYNQVVVTISGDGNGATARAVLGPKGGFGADPRDDLRAHFAAINARLTGTEGGDFPVNNDFRQITLIRNPIDAATTNVATADTLSTTKNLAVALTGSWSADDIIEGDDSGAVARVVSYDSVNGIVNYMQDETTGFVDFTTSDTIFIQGTSANGAAVTAVNDAEAVPYEGETIFLENRTPVNRAEDQIETIKLVLEF